MAKELNGLAGHGSCLKTPTASPQVGPSNQNIPARPVPQANQVRRHQIGRNITKRSSHYLKRFGIPAWHYACVLL
jgi:hypothetical protein